MRKVDLSKGADTNFLKFKSYSVDQIMAADGTTKFENKIGKNPENIIKRLEKLSKEDFITDEEVETALKMLKASK